MTRHLADRRTPPTVARLRAFLRIARGSRKGWHRAHAQETGSRLKQYLRIARGRTA